MTTTTVTAASVLVALFSSVAAYLLGAVVLPALAAFVKRDRALRKLNLPTPKPRGVTERLLGTMCRCDPSTPANYCRTAVMGEWFDELGGGGGGGGDPPVLVTRGLDKHLVVVVDPAAATAVLSRSGGLEKSTQAYEGINFISDAAGKRNVLSHETSAPEWKLARKAIAPSFSQAELKSKFDRSIRSAAEAAADALARICDAAAADASDSSSSSTTKAKKASIDIDELAASTAMDVITSFGFGVRTNAVERLGAKLAREQQRKRGKEGEGDDDDGDDEKKKGEAPVPIPAPLVPGAEDTVELLRAAAEAAELYVVEPWRSWFPFRHSAVVRRGKESMRRVRGCIAAVLSAAHEAEAAKKKKVGEKTADGDDGGGETIFSRLSAVAPKIAALDPTGREDASAVLTREAGLLYFAGIDTSSHTLAYTLALLAAHPRVARIVEEELDAAGLLATQANGGEPRRLEFSDLSKSALPYLNAVLAESMRLLPVAAGGTARTVGRGGFELTIPDWEAASKSSSTSSSSPSSPPPAATRTVVIPEGVDLWVPLFVVHNARSVWGDDAAEFKPERFLDASAPFASASVAGGEAGGRSSDGGGEAGISTSDAPRRFMPFSLGARDCVGQGLARTALIAELIVLFGRFSFAVDREKMEGSLVSKEEGGLGETVIAREAITLTLQVMGGIWLEVEPRVKKGEVGKVAEE